MEINTVYVYRSHSQYSGGEDSQGLFYIYVVEEPIDNNNDVTGQVLGHLPLTYGDRRGVLFSQANVSPRSGISSYLDPTNNKGKVKYGRLKINRSDDVVPFARRK